MVAMRLMLEDIPVRSGAVALWVAGPLLTAAVLPHPTILDGDVGGVVSDTGWWSVLHLFAALGIALGWWGVTCTLAVHHTRLRAWASPIFASVTVGAFVLGSVMIVEAFAFPVLADRAPDTLELDGPIFASWTFRLVAPLGGGFLLGLVLLGWVLARARVWPAAGATLAASTVAFTLFGGMFVPVLGPLSTIAMATSAGWLGLLLWRCAPVAAQPT